MRNLKSIAGAVAFMVLWAGAALAMPTSLFSPDEQPSAVAELVEDGELEVIELEPTPEGETVDVTVPEDEGDGSHEGEEKADNHGKAVSTAAHCDLKGRAKGQLVSSVARDKSATVESAQAACDAAIAAAAAGVSSKPVKAPKPPKAERAPKPEQVSKSANPKSQHSEETEESPEVEVTDTEEAPAPDSGPPAHAGPSADKGSKKP